MIIGHRTAMRFDQPFPLPKHPPCIPPRLSEQIGRYLDRTHRIEIFVRGAGKRWEKLNVLHLDGEPAEPEVVAALVEGSADEVRVVAALVKAAADDHAKGQCRSGKYHAILLGRIGERDKRHATFEVDLEAEARRAFQRTRIKWSRSSNGWVNLVEGAHALAELMVRYNHRVMDQLAEQQRIREERNVQTLTVILEEMLALYNAGLAMKAETARELTEQRVQEQLAQARAQLDARVWETFAPILEMAVARFGEMFEQQRNAAGDAVEPDGEHEAAVSDSGGEHEATGEPDAERDEGAPPSTGDAPSPGELGSGA